jgi:hypothetical protein
MGDCRMSTSNIIKVNQLAQEFMKHGIVANSQEAFAKAEAALQQSESSPGAMPSLEESETIMAMKRDISIMQKSISDLEKQVMYLTTKASSMSAEILALKTRPVVVEQKHSEVQTTISGEPVKQQPQQQAQQQAQPLRARAATQTIKGSTFSEDDIAIDKIFYFGQKK